MRSKLIHAVKGLAMFVAIYMVAAVIAEIILIVGLTAMGYDALHGQMPDSFWVGLFPLYGFAIFAILSLLFHRVVRKKKFEDLKMRFCAGTILELSGGMATGAILVGAAIIFLTLIGAYKFNGISKIDIVILIATFGAYLIQGFSEELLCRGLLQNYFEERLSITAAVLLSAFAFILPHAATIVDLEPVEMALSFVNLLCVSVLFSLSMIRFNSMWVPVGIHIGWNFVLSYICGISVSGGEGGENLLNFSVNSAEWLHGGVYGIEAGFVVTVILLVCDLFLYKMTRGQSHGRSFRQKGFDGRK